jgi:putative ABC transport system ATP-binding protein
MSRKILFTARRISKQFRVGKVDVTALDGVDCEIYEGELIALRGPSGSGKSTLLNILGLLEQMSEGSLQFDGVDLAKASEKKLTQIRRRHIGFIFQNFNLIPILSALENVEYPLYLEGELGRRDIRNRALEMLRSVGLGDLARNRPAQLSGGQRQRVAIARALVKNPRVVFADEPTANLDSQTALDILAVIQKMRCEHGTSVVIATHDATVSDVAERHLLLRDGCLEPQAAQTLRPSA